MLPREREGRNEGSAWWSCAPWSSHNHEHKVLFSTSVTILPDEPNDRVDRGAPT